MKRISKKYAEALFQIACENNLIEQFKQQLLECVNIFLDNPIIYELLLNPQNSLSSKKALIEAFFEGNKDKNIISFVKLLNDHNRLNLLSDIYSEYISRVHNYNNTQDIKVVSASSLCQKEVFDIEKKIKSIYSLSKVNLSQEIDEDLIGGFKIIIKNEVIDCSLKGIMDEMKNQLISR